MKKYFFFVIITYLYLFNTNLYAQDYEPTILVLSPFETYADEKLRTEIEEINQYQSEREQNQLDQLRYELDEYGRTATENIIRIYEKQIEFLAGSDFYSMIPDITADYLLYRFYERFENLLIYPVKDSSIGRMEDLISLCEAHEMQYVVNFPSVKSNLTEAGKETIVRVQLFDSSQNKILLDEEYIGDDKNQGFYFACNDSTLYCTINNSLSLALEDIISIVAANSPTLNRERELAQRRAETLSSIYHSSEPARGIIDLIGDADSTLSTGGFYQGLINKDSTKFVGFFVSLNGLSNFEELRSTGDDNVQIITDDLTNFDDIPKVCAYVIVGIKHESKLYVEKSNVTYFSAENLEAGRMRYFNNLQGWNFFMDNSIELNPEFWETSLFRKVPDLTLEPDYEE